MSKNYDKKCTVKLKTRLVLEYSYRCRVCGWVHTWHDQPAVMFESFEHECNNCGATVTVKVPLMRLPMERLND